VLGRNRHLSVPVTVTAALRARFTRCEHAQSNIISVEDPILPTAEPPLAAMGRDGSCQDSWRPHHLTVCEDGLERVKGIEPSCAAWEAAVLPLNYTREVNFRSSIVDLRFASCDLHCQEITSSSFVPVFLLAAGPGTLPDCPSLPNDQAITPI
jgi:hypothetical protein